MSALEALFNNSPTIAAARSVLFGQLFSGGITLRRDGAPVELTPVFQAHILRPTTTTMRPTTTVGGTSRSPPRW